MATDKRKPDTSTSASNTPTKEESESPMITYPRVALKQMDPSKLVFELNRETQRLMPESSELITSAASMASFLHRNQTRMIRRDMPRVPYIEHPLRVALRLIRWGITDAEIIAAGLLHDVAEDCADEMLELFGRPGDNAIQCIARMYGERVAEMVHDVTNPVDPTVSYRQHLQELVTSGSMGLLIKASDLKDNAGSIRHQLGHDRDESLLRRVQKYYPVISPVAAGLAARGDAGPIADDMRELSLDLEALAHEHGLVL